MLALRRSGTHLRCRCAQVKAQGALAPPVTLFNAVLMLPEQCDRVFPCQSCCKRGCAEICPDGSLTGGKGSRCV